MIDHEQKVAGVKMTFGAFLTSATAITLNEWVAICTIIYFVLQIGLLVPKYIELWKKKRNGKV
jgi:hypothetical protein